MSQPNLTSDVTLGFKRSVTSSLNDNYNENYSDLSSKSAWWPQTANNKQYLEIVAEKPYFIKNLVVRSGNPYSYCKTFSIAVHEGNNWVTMKSVFEYSNPRKGSQNTFYEINVFSKGIRIIPQSWENSIFLKAELEIIEDQAEIKSKLSKLNANQLKMANKMLGIGGDEQESKVSKSVILKKDDSEDKVKKEKERQKEEKEQEYRRKVKLEQDEKDKKEKSAKIERDKKEAEQQSLAKSMVQSMTQSVSRAKENDKREEKTEKKDVKKKESGNNFETKDNDSVTKLLKQIIKNQEEQNELLQDIYDNYVTQENLEDIFKKLGNVFSGFKF